MNKWVVQKISDSVLASMADPQVLNVALPSGEPYY